MFLFEIHVCVFLFVCAVCVCIVCVLVWLCAFMYFVLWLCLFHEKCQEQYLKLLLFYPNQTYYVYMYLLCFIFASYFRFSRPVQFPSLPFVIEAQSSILIHILYCCGKLTSHRGARIAEMIMNTHCQEGDRAPIWTPYPNSQFFEYVSKCIQFTRMQSYLQCQWLYEQSRQLKEWYDNGPKTYSLHS